MLAKYSKNKMATRICFAGAVSASNSFLNFSKVTCRCPAFKFASRNSTPCLASGVRFKSTKHFYSAQADSFKDEETEKAYTHFGFENVTKSEKQRKGI